MISTAKIAITEQIKIMIAHHQDSDDLITLITTCLNDDLLMLVSQTLGDVSPSISDDLIDALTSATENGVSESVLAPIFCKIPDRPDLIFDLLPRVLIEIRNDPQFFKSTVESLLESGSFHTFEILNLAFDLSIDPELGSEEERLLSSSRVISIIFDRKGSLSPTSVSILLNKYLSQFKISPVIVLAAIKSLILFPVLSNFMVESFVPRLSRHPDCQSPIIFEGLIRLCLLLGPISAKVMLFLNPEMVFSKFFSMLQF
ncbi:hypothetical protein GEMRC1_011648 [Eukaryota sp. GEM-RC1]